MGGVEQVLSCCHGFGHTRMVHERVSHRVLFARQAGWRYARSTCKLISRMGTRSSLIGGCYLSTSDQYPCLPHRCTFFTNALNTLCPHVQPHPTCAVLMHSCQAVPVRPSDRIHCGGIFRK